MSKVSKYGYIGVIKRVRRKKTVKSKTDRRSKIKSKKSRQSTYDIQIEGNSNRNRGSRDRIFEGNKIRIDDESSKDKNKETQKKEKDVKETKKINRLQKFIQNLSKTNQESFGSGKLECCKLNE